MTRVSDILVAINGFIDSRIDMIVGGNPLLNLAQPFIKRAVRKQVDGYTSQMKKYLDLLADKDGNIEIESIVEEITNRFNTMEPITIPTETMGDVVVGKGKLTVEIPALFGGKPRSLTFTADDIADFKSMIIKK